MASKLIVLSALLAAASCVPQAQYGYGAPWPSHDQAPEPYDAHPKYTFAFQDEGPHTGEYSLQHETRDGDRVEGEYSLVEPDRMKRTVQYTDDDHNGFNREVKWQHAPGFARPPAYTVPPKYPLRNFTAAVAIPAPPNSASPYTPPANGKRYGVPAANTKPSYIALAKNKPNIKPAANAKPSDPAPPKHNPNAKPAGNFKPRRTAPATYATLSSFGLPYPKSNAAPAAYAAPSSSAPAYPKSYAAPAAYAAPSYSAPAHPKPYAASPHTLTAHASFSSPQINYSH